MKKIPTLFERSQDGLKLVINKVTPGCEWVISGEGYATVKIDGSCCMVRNGALYKRRELKSGQLFPKDFEVADTDPVTGKVFGWMPVGDGPEDQWHREAWQTSLEENGGHILRDGTYELCGPKVQGNAEGFDVHNLWSHEATGLVPFAPRDFDTLDVYLATFDAEGIVWKHPDGRMAKIKRKDFGYEWPMKHVEEDPDKTLKLPEQFKNTPLEPMMSVLTPPEAPAPVAVQDFIMVLNCWMEKQLPGFPKLAQDAEGLIKELNPMGESQITYPIIGMLFKLPVQPSEDEMSKFQAGLEIALEKRRIPFAKIELAHIGWQPRQE